jgi:hypothetical protein
MKSAMSSRTTHWAMTVLIQRILPALLLAPLLSLSAAAVAAGERMSFHGSITQPTCAVAPIPAGHDRSRIAASGMTVAVDTACGTQGVPVSTHFLPVSPTATIMVGSGILVLTYQ